MSTPQAALKTKKPTPLSTRALAAYLTWKQFDLLLLLAQEGTLSTRYLSEELADIKAYDQRHGGAFYSGTDYSSCYSCLRTMEERQLVNRFMVRGTSYIEWAVTARGRKAIEWLEGN